MTTNTKPGWLVEREITLDEGVTALWSYDTEGDILEIFFERGPATATVELTQGVFMRFNRQARNPLSLGFVSVTPLLKPGEFGPALLHLDGLDTLSPEMRQVVLEILTSPPVNYVFKVFSYRPAPDANSSMALGSLQPLAA